MTNPPPPRFGVAARRLRLRTLVLAMVVAGAGVSALPAEAARAESGSIEGVVLGPGGRPVANALVAAVPEQMGSSEEQTRAAAFSHTDAGGRFRFDALPAGSYGVTAMMAGHAAAYAGGIRVRADSTLRDVRLESPGAGIVLSGLITSETDAPIPGAEFRATRYSDFQGDVFYAHADSSGRFTVELPHASYALMALAPGRETTTVARQSDESRTLRFVLTPLYPAGPAPDSVVAWFRQAGIPLLSVEAEDGFSDMRPLGDWIGDASVVAVGEATHGTREFFQLKHRMLEYLVREKGFTVFAIEASMPEAFELNDYVLTGRGDPAAALHGLYFWTWDTQEVLDMVRWMRRYNADPTHVRKVRFYGFDIQFASRAVKTLVAYLRRVDRAEGDRAADSLAPIADAYTVSRFGNLPATRQAAIAATLDSILRMMDSRRVEFSRATGEAAWALARQHGVIASQFVALAQDPSVRDRAMAQNIGWILDREGPEAKMLVWAHNGHVSCSAEEGSGMGAQLRRMLGDRLFVFGFAFDQGAFQAIGTRARGLRDFTVGPAPVGSLDETLSRAGDPIAAFPLDRVPPKGLVAAWMAARHLTRDIGAVYDDSLPDAYFARQLIRQHYDALLFVDRTTAARPTRPRTAATAPPDTTLNLDFELGRAGDVPTGWGGSSGPGMAYRAENSRDRPRHGAQCAEIRSLPLSGYGEWFGILTKIVKAAPYAGRRVRLRAAVRVRTIDPGCSAHLWLRYLRRESGKVIERGNVEPAEGPIRAAEWRDYAVTATIPSDAFAVNFGLALVGDGAAWLDAVSLEPMADQAGR